MSALLRVENVHKQFGKIQALAGLNCELEEGEWLGLLGPNGAGKTTLIRAISGRVKLDQGQIWIAGQLLDGSTAARKVQLQVGIIPQDIALYPMLTAEENLRIFGALQGLSGKQLQKRLVWALEWTGLNEHRQELLKGFSGGMKRRLNLACGILHQPRIVLLDEPTVGVDPQSRARIWEMLTELQRQGVSLLLTTHQLDEAQLVCERIVIIDAGQTIAQGSMNELFSNTVGTQRIVNIRMQAPSVELLKRFNLVLQADESYQCTVNAVASELANILNALAAANVRVDDLTLETPSLQSVFLALTGHGLRE